MSSKEQDERKDEIYFLTKEEVQEAPDTEDSSEQAAFNPDTKEINWDCPCLGGMAHGPCGEDFKTAFSCFVFSEVEPKGADCIDKFQAMQKCFQNYPEYYADQLKEDDEINNDAVETKEDSISSAESTVLSQEVSAEPESVINSTVPNTNEESSASSSSVPL